MAPLTVLPSTGPGTPNGKHVVVLKPIRQGLRARTVVLPGENRQECHQLCDDLESEWNPRSRTEQFYLEQMAVNQWKLTRLEVGEINVFKKDGDNIRLLDRLWQAQCRMERSYARAQRELERLQATRRRQIHQPEEAATVPQPVAAVASAEPPSNQSPGATQPQALVPGPFLLYSCSDHSSNTYPP